MVEENYTADEPVNQEKPRLQEMTVREVIIELTKCSDLDATAVLSIYNSDPVPVVSVSEIDDNQVQLRAGN